MTISSTAEPSETPQLRMRYSSHVWNVIVRDPLALTSTLIILFFLFVAVFAPYIAPYPAQGMGRADPQSITLPPSRAHPFGTDHLGRDVLSRVIMGSRPAMAVPIGVVAVAVLIGAPLGALAGYKGGWIDEFIMRITDLFLAFPSLLLAMAITAAWDVDCATPPSR